MKKRILALLLAFCLLATLTAIAPITASAETYGNFTYTISGGEVTITGYDATASGDAVTIPGEIGGCPVTAIGAQAFVGCSGINNITIPDSVTSIGEEAFSGTAYFNDGANWEDGVLYIGKHLIKANTTTVSDYAVKEGTISIADYAFDSCEALGSITLPDSLRGIGDYAFYGCKNLKSVSIPGSVTSVGASAFNGCIGMTSVTISEGVRSIGDSAFYDCKYIESITIPESVESIGGSAFAWCLRLADITFPESVPHIGQSVFYETAYYGNEDNWENDVLYFGKHLMGAKESLTGAYEIKAGTKYIAEFAFSYCSISGVTIPESITSISAYAFSSCYSLTAVSIPKSVTSIGEGAFSYCQSLASITLPKSVTSIGEEAFSYCTSLTSVTLPEGVRSIEYLTFAYCTSLTSITIPRGVTVIGGMAFDSASLTDIYYAGSEAEWNRISINTWIDDTTVTIHYGSEEEPFGISFDKSSNEITITAVEAVSEASLLVARYLDGEPLEIEPMTISLSAGENTIDSPMSDYSGADTVQIMLWESLTNVRPLCGAYRDTL